jgi:hypothetical protein
VGILNNIPRKNAAPIFGSPFTPNDVNAHAQHVPNGFEGLSYNSPFTDTDTPPLATNFNTATEVQLPATRAQIPGVQVHLRNWKRVNPFFTSASFNTGKPVPLVKRQGGPSSHSDTPFHPIKHTKLPPKTVAVNISGEKISPPQGSFFDTTGGATLTGHANNDPRSSVTKTPMSRWKTIKTGAANV